MAEHRTIAVRGARMHNLKSLDVDIPRNQLVVMTGVSGSGKSSLAFGTIYAEGQRRYVESLSAYARQFLDQMEKPEVESITGLSPAIAIEQKTTSRNPRSTVGTVTEIYDYLRLLFARTGTPYSPATGLPITAAQVQDMVDRVMALPEGTRGLLLAPVVRDRKGEYRKEMEAWRAEGFQRFRIDGTVYAADELPTLDKKFRHDIELVVDRVAVRPGMETRLADSFRTALDKADGIAYFLVMEGEEEGDRLIFSERFACPVSGFTIPEIEPRLFSFNAPFGACPACEGLGFLRRFSEERVIPDSSLSLYDGAIAPWAPLEGHHRRALTLLGRHLGFELDTPWRDLPRPVRTAILEGHENPAVLGVLEDLQRRWNRPSSPWARDDLERWRKDYPCQACGGYRLKPEALAVKITGMHLGEVANLSIREAAAWIETVSPTLGRQKSEIAAPIVKEIRDRLGFLVNVGLDYLTLSRAAGTLSGGESQRIRLASQIGSGLTGVLYVLDEPSIGLHQRDNERLLHTLMGLRDNGNTVLVVEHDEEAIRLADWVLDIGPGAGVHGGQLVAAGKAGAIAKNKKSLTGQYLAGTRRVSPPREPRAGTGAAVVVKGAKANNLKNLTARFPLGTLTAVTGVSGSGKSTLVVETLARALAARLNGAREDAAEHAGLEGLEHLDKAIEIDQRPIGRTPRSNPATYTGAFTPIRDWFAGLPESKARGYGPGRFSFNVKGGRCEACQGDGVLKIEMNFLPDIYVTCEVCKGARFNRETLEIRHKGKSIADVLDMTIEEAAEFFSAVPAIRDKMRALNRVGLGYAKVGQPATTLSGGEAQRVKLARELSKRATGRTFYILDEPTTGLHFEDVRALLAILQELVDQGNTVLVIEHNLDVIAAADWIVDIGPEGGDGGGRIVAEGTPATIAATPASETGRFLAPVLAALDVPVPEAPPKGTKRPRAAKARRPKD